MHFGVAHQLAVDLHTVEGLRDPVEVDVVPDCNEGPSTAIWTGRLDGSRRHALCSAPALGVKHVPAPQAAHSLSVLEAVLAY